MRIRKDNRGVALITVVIGVMFCLLLTSTMLRVSLLGLNSRSVNNKTSDTYYDAETAIDSMALNIQNFAAKAWEETKASNTTSSKAYVEKIYSYLMGEEYPDVADTVMDISPSSSGYTTLKSILAANLIQGGTIVSVGSVEKYIGTTNSVEGFTIKDVKVEYVNPTTGMMSNVKTDMTVRAPLYKKIESSGYSMLAGGGMELKGESSQSGTLRLSGNSYSGYKTSTYHKKDLTAEPTRKDSNTDYSYATAVTYSNQINMFYEGAATFNGDLIISGNSRVAFLGGDANNRCKVVVRGCIILDSTSKLFISNYTDLECRAIYVGGTGNLNNASYLIGSNGTYSTPNVEPAPFNHLPYAFKEKPGGNGFDNTYNDYGPIFICTGVQPDSCECGSVYTVNVSSGVISNASNITFKDLEPKENESGYDIEYLKIVDTEYMQKVKTCCDTWGTTYPPFASNNLGVTEEKSYTVDGETKTDYKYKPTDYDGTMGQHLYMYEGATKTIQVMIGKADEVSNQGYHFIISADTLNFKDFNNGSDVWGVFIAPQIITAGEKDGGTAHIKALSSVPGASTLTTVGDVTKTNYQWFVDRVGSGYMNKQGSASKYYLVANLIHGGMSTLYSEDASTQYQANVQINSTMNLITFSNFERY